VEESNIYPRSPKSVSALITTTPAPLAIRAQPISVVIEKTPLIVFLSFTKNKEVIHHDVY
jgi:hypothetical protein